MAELRALRVAGRAAGIHLDGAVVRRDRDARVAFRLRREPIGVIDPGAMRTVERDDPANRFQLVGDLLDERIEVGTDEQQLSAGVLDHISRLGRRQTEIDRHQHHVGLGRAEPQLEKGRHVLGQNGDACLRPHALGDEAVGDAIGPAVKLAIGEMLPLEMEGDGVGPDFGMMLGDIGNRRNFGDVGNVEHLRPPQNRHRGHSPRCLSRLVVAQMLGIFAAGWKPECAPALASLRRPRPPPALISLIRSGRRCARRRAARR